MPKSKPTLTAPRTTKPRSEGLRDAFAPCPICGQAVLVQVAKTVTVEWHNPTTDEDELVRVLRWDRQAVALDPVLGDDHHKRCREAKGLQPLWIQDGHGGERFTWLHTATGEILEIPPPATPPQEEAA